MVLSVVLRSFSRHRVGLILIFITSLLSDVSFADENALALKVKSAFIYNFTKFLTWPEASFSERNDPISICVAGNGEILEPLKQIVEGKTVQNRLINAFYIDSLDEIELCRILYLARSSGPLSYWESASNVRNLISIGDGSNFIEQGGTIGFVAHEGKIRFEINQSSARKQQVQISSKLLSLAQRVVY